MSNATLEEPGEDKSQDAPIQDESDDLLTDTQSLPVQKHRAHAAPRARTARRAVLVALCAVVVAALAVAGFLEAERFSHEQERLAEQKRILNTPKPVEVVLGIPPSNTTHDMPVAIRVTGTTQKGSKVDEAQVISLDEPNLMLVPGTYTARLEGNSLSSDGLMYRGSTDTFDFAVVAEDAPFGDVSQGNEEPAQEDSQSDSEAEASPKTQTLPVFAFLVVPPQKVTDEDLESVRSWLEAAGSDPVPYVDAAVARRNETVEQIRADGEARDNEQMSQVEGIVGYVNEQLYARELAKAEEEKKKEDASNSTSQENEQQEEDKQ